MIPTGTFIRARGLADLLYADERLHNCWVRNTFRQASAHIETEGEEPAIEYLDARFEESGFSVRELLVEFVTSDAFRIVGQPE